MKKCSTCKIEKEFSEFHKNKCHKYGLDAQCKACKKERSKKYYKATKDKQLEYKKKYRQLNKEKVKEARKKRYQSNKHKVKVQVKKWREANKYKMNTYQREYDKERKKIDPLYKMKSILRDRTSKAIKYNGYSKKSKTREMLGVDWEVCKAHIERQFKKGMNWDNHGEWHIDHIIPLASANNEKELIKLCHYSNLQPLWAEDNLIKKDKIIECQVKLRI